MPDMPRMPNLADLKSPVPELLRTLTQQGQVNQHRTEQATAASLASGLIAASGRAHSIQEALELMFDIQYALYPSPGAGRYQKWAETKADTLAKVRS